jgi:hypothetical protein
VEGQVLRPSLCYDSVLLDEWCRHPIHQDGSPGTNSLGIPIGILGFQNAPPCQNSIPFVELVAPCSSRWGSWMSNIWGRFWGEDNHVLISYCLVESLPSPLTLRETIVRGRSDMCWER